MITQDELTKMLASLEAERIEKTISKTDADKFGEAICSFCNDMAAHGLPGYLLVGVNDDGSLNGTIVDEKLMQTLLSYRTDGRIVPPPAMTVTKFTYPEGDVAVVEVQPSSVPPVRYKGKVCIRIGPRKGTANEAEERILSEKRSTFARSFDTEPCYGSILDDLSIDIFKITYLPSAIDQETLIANGREIKEQLSSLKFYDLRADCPTYSGILMFGKNPRFFLSGAAIQYVRFVGEDEISDFDYETKFEGDLTTQMKIIDNFIKLRL
jgi:ATP-dependent DNA helicase RecG